MTTYEEDQVLNIVRTLEDIVFWKRSYEDSIQRNFLFYAWILQHQYGVARYEELMNLLGLASDENKDAELRIVLASLRRLLKVIEDDFCSLTDEAMDAVAKVFDMDEGENKFGYRILRQMPYFSNVSSSEFVEYLHLLRQPRSERFSGMVVSAFQAVLSDISVGDQETNLGEYGKAYYILAPQNKWSFILGIYPYKGLLSRSEISEFMAQISEYRDTLSETRTGRLKALLFYPGVDRQNVKFPNRFKAFYHVWGLGSLRFFHLLEDAIGDEKEIATECFMSIFTPLPDQDAYTAYSIRGATKALRDAIGQKKN